MGRWRLQADKFLNFHIPIPPYDEQKIIADYITEMKDIYKAIKYHSNKKKLTNNIFYKILCDADILSKFTPQTVYKYRKENEIFHFVI